MNWHALTGDDDVGNAYTVVFHLPVPGTGNSRANVQWRAALAASGLNKTILPDGTGAAGTGTISASEKTAVTNGTLYEYVTVQATRPGETGAQLIARMDALFTSFSTSVIASLQNKLNYFGALASGGTP